MDAALKQEEPHASIAVIVCSRNRGAMLSRTLQALREQTTPAAQFDIIVVDDASEDDTRARVLAAASSMPNLRLVASAERIRLARARNFGVENCEARYLLFTDDDCIPARDWVARMRDALEREPIVAGAVQTRREGYLALCHNVSHFYAFMPNRKAGPVRFIAGANMGLRRGVLESVGGFRQVTPHAEDMEFILRAMEAGHRPWFAPEAVVVHAHHRNSLSEVVRYAAEHAESTIHLRRRYRRVLQTPFVLNSPALLLIASPLIATKVCAGIYLNGAMRFWKTLPVVYLTKLAWCFGAARALRRERQGGTPC